MVEGESVILTASFLAYKGHLSIFKIMIVAFCGTLFADQALYHLGHYYGPDFLERFPKMKKRSTKAFKLLRKWDVWYILIFRFIYGIRIVSPIVIGTAGIPPWRFIPLNFISAVVWTIVSCGLGFLFGEIIEHVLHSFHLIQKYFLFILIGIICLGILITAYLRRKKKS